MHSLPIKYYSNWINKTLADNLFLYLLDNIPWEEESVLLFGRRITVPRLIYWMADRGCIYRYSGNTHHPHPWIPRVKSLCSLLNTFLQYTQFNSVLCNLYRNGHDYIGWHQDNEPELKETPIIASISLGVERKFSFRHTQTKQRIDKILEHASLLVMHSNSQSDWEHSLPKYPKCNLPRINLTFRTIFTR